MRKTIKNEKGFTLVELLIVIAIIGILAAISITMFSGVVTNSRKKADDEQANNIQRALTTYIAETGDTTLSKIGSSSVGTLITALQTGTSMPVAGNPQTFGPYLTAKNNVVSYDTYAPQWSGYTGYKITVSTGTGNVSVIATGGVTSATAVTQIQ